LVKVVGPITKPHNDDAGGGSASGSVVNDDEGSGHAERRTGAVYMGGEGGKKSWENNETLVDQAGPRTIERGHPRGMGWMISDGGWKDHEV
jgi:hypothetical protein